MATHDVPLNVRVPRDLLERIEALRKTLVTDVAVEAGGLGRSYVVRLALERGVASLERPTGGRRTKR